MSTRTDIVTALKGHAPLSAIISDRVFADALPDETKGQVSAVVVRLIGGPPFQNGVGVVVATTERWRITAWSETSAQRDSMVVPIQDALLTLWGDYEVTMLEANSGMDERTRLRWHSQDLRLIGCV